METKFKVIIQPMFVGIIRILLILDFLKKTLKNIVLLVNMPFLGKMELLKIALLLCHLNPNNLKCSFCPTF